MVPHLRGMNECISPINKGTKDDCMSPVNIGTRWSECVQENCFNKD